MSFTFHFPSSPFLSVFSRRNFFWFVCLPLSSSLHFGENRFWETFWDCEMGWKEVQAGRGTTFS